ncbi:hypothetical protein POM88_032748 [Heracleum sosnowskyi]|uniref:Peptidase M48 domain-containing protein n=1 Tax=Heracleum sosnowskyi TaxID=360622 RepID=A0AAD8I2U0_9APIA|nr:hypothetical protein POM88_032748 [Heracleum sosnowskyi]
MTRRKQNSNGGGEINSPLGIWRDSTGRHLKSDAEIAAVISHEVGHLVARHPAESFTKAVLLAIGVIIIVLGSLGILPPAKFFLNPSRILPPAEIFLNPSRRRREKEADYIGQLLMASAGYDPRECPKVYEKLDQDHSSHSKYSALFLTHPSGRERSQALSEPQVMTEAMTRFSKVMERQRGLNSETGMLHN